MLTRAVTLVVLLLAGCHSGTRHGSPEASASPAVASSGPPRLRHCSGAGDLPKPTGGFHHLKSKLVGWSGSPRHQADDVLATPGAPLRLTVKIAYGKLSKDLEGEDVRAFVDVCGSWLLAGSAKTNDDGRASVEVKAALAPGVHDLRFQVADGSTASARLWLLPRGSHLVVTDVDATLTTSDSELARDLWSQLEGDSFVEHARPGAVDLTNALAARGAIVVYLTGRPYLLANMTRRWLDKLGFAPGVLMVTHDLDDSLPTQGGVGDFKQARLRALTDAGFVLDAGYGNAPTDIAAYLGAGLPAASIFIVGAHGGERGTQAAADWTARATAVLAGPATAQPFSWTLP